MQNSFKFDLVAASGISFEEMEYTQIFEKVKDIQLRLIPIVGDAKHQVMDDWYSQYSELTVDKDKYDFKTGMTAGKNEVLKIENYELPEYFKSRDSNDNEKLITPAALDIIRNKHIESGDIKMIIGFTTYNDEELILFQKFNTAQKLTKSMMAFILHSNTFNRIGNPGLILGNKLMAAYNVSTKRLMFKSFDTVRNLLELNRYFQLPSEQEIESMILNSKQFFAKNIDELLMDLSYLLAKRFAIVQESGILNKVTVEDIRLAAKKNKINIKLVSDGSQIIFPSKKSEAHNLLRLLNDEYFVGDLSKDNFHAKNKRKNQD